ncbi:MAG: hypothetical protein RIC51_08590 [Erythrobacter sp.]|uniref:hypothetical protein n=1 Tax=Erythrobacter sp. TaxID=1042 RepID=UPI0032EC1B9C
MRTDLVTAATVLAALGLGLPAMAQEARDADGHFDRMRSPMATLGEEIAQDTKRLTGGRGMSGDSASAAS